MRHPHEDYSLLALSVVDSLMHVTCDEHVNSFKLNMFDKVDAHMCYHDSCASLISNTCLHDVFNDSSSIGSTVTEFMDSMYVNYDFDDDCTSISSLSSYNPLEEGSLLTFVGQTKDGGCEFTKEIEKSSSQGFDFEEYEALRRSRLHKLREKLYLKEHALADSPHVSTLSGNGDADLNKSVEASNSERPNCCDDLKQPLIFSDYFDELPQFDDDFYEPQVLQVEMHTLVPSIIEPPTLELKPLPPNLKYAYLLDEGKLPVIVSNALSSLEEGKLLEVLRRYKRPLGGLWPIFLA